MGALFIFIFAYLIGSVSSAILVCSAMGLDDPRTQGSKNPGATNVLRMGGKKAAALTLLGDVLKGLLPVVLAQAFLDTPWITSGTMLCAILGHMFPVWFRFQGGKGVATLIGALMGLSMWVALCWGLVFAGVFYFRRIVSLASIVASMTLPLFAVIFLSLWYVIPMAVIAMLVVWRHKENIERLRKGEEKVIDLSKFSSKLKGA